MIATIHTLPDQRAVFLGAIRGDRELSYDEIPETFAIDADAFEQEFGVPFDKAKLYQIPITVEDEGWVLSKLDSKVWTIIGSTEELMEVE